MIKVDQVMVNRLEQFAKIELNMNEREKLRLEIIRALEFVDHLLVPENNRSISSIHSVMDIDNLREDISEKTLFPFFDNIPDRFDDYVVVTNR